MRQWWLSFMLLLITCHVGAQTKGTQSPEVTLTVCDRDSKLPLIGALVRMDLGKKSYTGATNADGEITFRPISTGLYQLKASYVGYAPTTKILSIDKGPQRHTIYLISSDRELQEVVVTAKASRGMTSSSLIGKEAMTHLQPSSIGDVLELLPGGFSSDPNLMSPDVVRLREAIPPVVGRHNFMPSVNQSNYNTSSMGTVFTIDGIPQKMDAVLPGMYGNNNTYKVRIPINAGVDMRTITTDDVESIEVVRGIPSVEHSDLTSGLIKVKRKQWTDEMSARFKSDMSSKLFYVSKGFSLLKNQINIIGSTGYLSAYSDPRSVRDCYERITGSLRATGMWTLPTGKISTHASVDYVGTLDDRKRDQDLDYFPGDSYRAGYHRLSFSQGLNFAPSEWKWLEDLDLTLSASHTWDQTYITKEMLLSRDVPYLTTKEEGAYEGRYYPREYVANHFVDSRPLYLYAKLKGTSKFSNSWSSQRVLYGATWTHSKNLGEGAIFDIERPLFWLSSSRPRPFNDVPAKSVLSLFVEDNLVVPIGAHRLTLMLGAVGNQLLALQPEYLMRGKWFVDFRGNIRWSFAPIEIKDKPLQIQLLAGAGSMSMFPSMEQLYPDTVYDDFVELNYYHSNPDYRLVYMRSYIYHPNSTQLKPAHNVKMEVRADVDYSGYSASVTYFFERMRDGFRRDTEVKIASFRSYDPLSVPTKDLTAKPSIEDFTYKDAKQFRLLRHDTNGSETMKTGVEWVMSTPRYSFLNTRVTFTGAWFRTIYKNSLPQYERPRVRLAGEEVPYVGLYEDNEMLVSELLNTDLRLDSYLPKIGLGVSLSFQSNWYSSSQKMPISIYPDYYIKLEDGSTHPFLEKDKEDAYLQWLKRSYNETSFERYVVPFMMITNLKATKQLFQNRLRVALFVNKIFDLSPDIHRNGYVIRRHQRPYFGMELMLTL